MSERPQLRPAPRLMLRESVYESVKRLLMDHDLQPGARLSIDGLSRDLQVSPTPVREALFRCEAEGLVVRRPNAGYTVGDSYASYREFADQDARLHGAIAAASGNPLIAETLERLRSHTHSYRLYFRHGIAAVTLAEHDAILAAVAAADADAAEQAMRTHLEASRTRLLTAYDDQ